MTISSESARSCQLLSRRHIPALDGLRGLAILLVLGFHFCAAFPLRPDSAAETLLAGFLQSGWCGVDLFFVLSGFLITGILYDTKTNHAITTSSYFRNFYARRVLRIFPLYYGLLVACFLVVPRLSLLSPADCDRIAADQPWYWLFCSNLKIALDGSPEFGFVSGFAALTWSLAIEEQFYLMWPLWVLVCRRTTLLRLCGAMVIGALALRVGLMAADVPRTSIYVFTPCRFDGLAIGAFISLVLRGQTDPQRLRRRARYVALAAGVALGGMFVRQGALRAGLAMTQSVGLTLLALLFGALLTLVVLSKPQSRLVRATSPGLLRTFGKYSYAIYLLHQLVFAGLVHAMPEVELPRLFGSRLPAYVGCLAIASLAALLAAMASWHLVERHFLKLKRFFEYDDRRRQPGAAVESRLAAGQVKRRPAGRGSCSPVPSRARTGRPIR